MYKESDRVKKNTSLVKEIAKKNELLVRISEKACVFGLSRKELDAEIKDFKVTKTVHSGRYLIVTEYMLNINLLGMSEDDDILNAFGEVSIRFVISDAESYDCKVVMGDIYGEWFNISMDIREAFEIINVSTDILDDTIYDFGVVHEVVGGLKPVDLVLLYYNAVRKYYE